MQNRAALVNVEGSASGARYAAPALEKGLDLLEALADDPGGLTQMALAKRLGRTVAEIFRMVTVLERRGYVARDAQTGQYSLTLRLFELANRYPPTRRLLHAALPVMQQLAETLEQSCHLVVVHGDRILVVADEQSNLPMGFSVRLGASLPLVPRYVSARVLVAFQPEPKRGELARRMLALQGAAEDELSALLKRLERIVVTGYDQSPSEVHRGITDISFPVRNAFGNALAALTVPFLAPKNAATNLAPVVDEIGRAALRVSRAIGGPAR